MPRVRIRISTESQIMLSFICKVFEIIQEERQRINGVMLKLNAMAYSISAELNAPIQLNHTKMICLLRNECGPLDRIDPEILSLSRFMNQQSDANRQRILSLCKLTYVVSNAQNKLTYAHDHCLNIIEKVHYNPGALNMQVLFDILNMPMIFDRVQAKMSYRDFHILNQLCRTESHAI